MTDDKEHLAIIEAKIDRLTEAFSYFLQTGPVGINPRRASDWLHKFVKELETAKFVESVEAAKRRG